MDLPLQLPAPAAPPKRRERPARRCAGFTLIELIVVILVVGILAAVAIPRLIDFGASSRAGLAQSAGAALRSAADMAHYSWALHSSNMGSVTVTLPDGKVAYMWRAYPDAGNCCAPDNGIETLTDITGLNVNQLDNARTRLEVPSAPSPAQCSATYTEATNPGDVYKVQVDISGC